MSYILDALKKAERERGLAGVPTLEAIHDLPKRNHSVTWTVSGIVVLCVLTVLWLLHPSNKKDLRAPVPEIAGADQSPIQPSAVSLPAVIPLQPVHPIETPVVPPKRTAEKPDAAMSSSSSDAYPKKAKPEVETQVLAPKQANPASFEVREKAAQPNIPSRNGESTSPAVQAKPISLHDAVAGMTLSIHLYSENKAERMVFINGKKYYEGDSLEQGIFLESITPEGAVLRSGGERAVLRQGSR
jgi:general secretion pathway protein B